MCTTCGLYDSLILLDLYLIVNGRVFRKIFCLLEVLEVLEILASVDNSYMSFRITS